MPQPLIPRRERGRGRGARMGRLPADDHVAGLAAQAHVQLVPGQLFDVGGIGQPLLLMLQRAQLAVEDLALGLQLVDLPALGDVLAHRVGEAERDRADHHGEHRGPAGEPRPVPALRAAQRRDHGPAGVLGKAVAPALICPQLVATARSAMVVSSVSPDRWLIMHAKPLRWASETASRVSVIVPIWLTLTRRAFAL